MKLSIYMQSIYDKVHGKAEFRDSEKSVEFRKNRNIFFVWEILFISKKCDRFLRLFLKLRRLR